MLAGNQAYAGSWVLQGAPEIIKPYQEWDEQGGGKGKIYDSGTDHVNFGFLSKEHGKTWWSKGTMSWSSPPPRIGSEEEISLELTAQTVIAGWGRGDPGCELMALLRDGPPETIGKIKAGGGTASVSRKAYKGGPGGKMTIEIQCYITSMHDGYGVKYHYDWVDGSNSGSQSGRPNPSSGSSKSPFAGSRGLSGTYDWIAGQVLVLHPNGTMQALVNDQPINSGRWTVLDRAVRKYQLTWDGGGFVDIITADEDFNTLRGDNNNGTPLIGKRKN